MSLHIIYIFHGTEKDLIIIIIIIISLPDYMTNKQNIFLEHLSFLWEINQQVC